VVAVVKMKVVVKMKAVVKMKGVLMLKVVVMKGEEVVLVVMEIAGLCQERCPRPLFLAKFLGQCHFLLMRTCSVELLYRYFFSWREQLPSGWHVLL
jgi:hypothetical protein